MLVEICLQNQISWEVIHKNFCEAIFDILENFEVLPQFNRLYSLNEKKYWLDWSQIEIVVHQFAKVCLKENYTLLQNLMNFLSCFKRTNINEKPLEKHLINWY
jgi:hypothetical protein